MTENENYTVLARKYRPNDLDGLIGQEALVRTLKNALKSGRLAHAFLLTGIRGVGKTSTARIIARTLNDIPESQGVDEHMDVVEMDAASNTGVDNVREIIEAAKYKPLSAPFKIYIIDEVHMLSKGAFNALLKTLEEPPEHVKFIFATTEIRKVPVTILSRCQRFDLRRVDTEVLSEHFKNIASKENVQIEDAAVSMISVAAEGSVRDGLSLLDQAIAYSDGKITTALVQEMLGFADKSQIIGLFKTLLAGEIGDALDLFANICKTSAEPQQILNDLLNFAHLVTRIKITPTLTPADLTQEEVEGAKDLAGKLSMQSLSFVWQMLLKSIRELQIAPNPKHAAEMALIRISYSTELTDPDRLIKKPKPEDKQEEKNLPKEFQGDLISSPTTYAELVEAFNKQGELILYNQLKSDVHLVSLKGENLEIRLGEHAPKTLPYKVAESLSLWTGKRWLVSVSNEGGKETLEESQEKQKADLFASAKEELLVQKTLELFPAAEILEAQEREEAQKNVGQSSA